MKKFLQMLLALLLCTTALCCVEVSASEDSKVEKVKEIRSLAVDAGAGAFSDEDVYLCAQLVHHEAHNQSYNGKVAVAEVVFNRVRSKLFPDTVSGVVSQAGQFSNSHRIKNINPSDLELTIANSVLNGKLRVFSDTGVLYFRNTKVTAGFSSKVEKNWGDLEYVTYIGDHAFYSQNIYNIQLALSDENGLATNKTANVANKIPSTEIKTCVEKAKDSEAGNSEEKKADAAELLALDPEFVINAVAMAGNDSSDVSVVSDSIAEDASKVTNKEDDEELEEIDENDPVAVAQRQAKIDQKRDIERKQALEAENVKANEAALELAEMNVQQAVDRVETHLSYGIAAMEAISSETSN